MRAWFAVVLVVLATLVAGAIFVASGFYDVAATEQHTRPVY
jgi:hypothetical protein